MPAYELPDLAGGESGGAPVPLTVTPDTFLSDLRPRYLQDPCRVSSIAWWKTEELCRTADTYPVTAAGHTALVALQGRRLVAYWSDDRDRFALSAAEVASLDFLVLHEDDYRSVADDLTGYRITPTNPMRYAGLTGPPPAMPADVVIRDYAIAGPGAPAVAADLLNRCYPGHRHTAAEVSGWYEGPAYDPTLWFWLCDASSGAPLALAISTYQPSIRETYLDWIQVLPEARGRGLGRLLVAETLRRALPKSDIVRVTGVADDFYRKCGFVGRERWYVACRSDPAVVG